MRDPGGEGYPRLIQVYEPGRHNPQLLGLPSSCHLQQSTSLPHPAAVAVNLDVQYTFLRLGPSLPGVSGRSPGSSHENENSKVLSVSFLPVKLPTK